CPAQGAFRVPRVRSLGPFDWLLRGEPAPTGPAAAASRQRPHRYACYCAAPHAARAPPAGAYLPAAPTSASTAFLIASARSAQAWTMRARSGSRASAGTVEPAGVNRGVSAGASAPEVVAGVVACEGELPGWDNGRPRPFVSDRGSLVSSQGLSSRRELSSDK